MKTKTMKSAAIAAAGTEDPRTSCAIALDEMAAWLIDRVPDRVPPGVPPLALAQPSWLSAIAGEYSRRMAAEHRGAIGYDDLAEALGRMPSELLAYNPSRETLAQLRAQVDRSLDYIQNPPAVTPLPAVWLEIAADLDVQLPIAKHHTESGACRSKGEDILSGAIGQLEAELRQLRPLLRELRRGVFHDPSAIEARRARHALAGDGVLPRVGGDSVFAATETELRFVSEVDDLAPAKAVAPHIPGAKAIHVVGPKLPAWYVEVVRNLLREPIVDTCPTGRSLGGEMAELERKRQPAGQVRDRAAQEKAEHQFQHDLHELQETAVAEAQAEADAWRASIEEQRRRLIARLDATLASMRLGGAWWFWRRLREAVAKLSPSDDGALEGMRLYRVRLVEP